MEGIWFDFSNTFVMRMKEIKVCVCDVSIISAKMCPKEVKDHICMCKVYQEGKKLPINKYTFDEYICKSNNCINKKDAVMSDFDIYDNIQKHSREEYKKKEEKQRDGKTRQNSDDEFEIVNAPKMDKCMCGDNYECYAEIHNCLCVTTFLSDKCMASITDHKCICNTRGPTTCKSHIHTCSCINFISSQCKSIKHDCSCGYVNNDNICKAEMHMCLCEKSGPEICKYPGIHDCICKKYEFKECRANRHYCCCTTMGSTRCSSLQGHCCTCKNEQFGKCKAVHHLCTCMENGMENCKAHNHFCSCKNSIISCRSVSGHDCTCNKDNGKDCRSTHHTCVCFTNFIQRKKPCRLHSHHSQHIL